MSEIRGRKLYALLRELASGDEKQTKLAEKYEISNARVSQLKRKHADEIADMRADLEDEFAGLWIAKKEERIKTYLRRAEAIEADLEQNGVDAQLTRALNAILKSVAEEMGQLPSRVIVQHQGPKADYTIGGVDPRELT